MQRLQPLSPHSPLARTPSLSSSYFGNCVSFRARRELYCRVVILEVRTGTDASKNSGSNRHLLIWAFPGQCPFQPLPVPNVR